jgi:hypothetical protein
MQRATGTWELLVTAKSLFRVPICDQTTAITSAQARSTNEHVSLNVHDIGMRQTTNTSTTAMRADGKERPIVFLSTNVKIQHEVKTTNITAMCKIVRLTILLHLIVIIKANELLMRRKSRPIEDM